jgi:hypothetical protein
MGVNSTNFANVFGKQSPNFRYITKLWEKKTMLSRVNAEPGFCPGSGGGAGPGQVNSRTWVHPARLSLLLVSQQRLCRGTSRVAVARCCSSSG